MNIQLDLSTDQYVVEFDFHPVLAREIKAVEGAKYIPSLKVWNVPRKSLPGLHHFAECAKQYCDVDWQKRAIESEMPDLLIPHQLKLEPRNYQGKGIARGLVLKRFINADEPGLGKTLQSIATVNIARSFPCLVICPSSLKINWEREWSKFTDKKAMVLTDDTRDNWPYYANNGLYQVFIVNYESLKKYFVLHEKKSERFSLKDVTFKENIDLFNSVIIDEIHRCKSATTQQSNYCKGIAQGKEYVIGLTGTPIVNKPKDLVPQLSIINRLEDFGGSINFGKQFCAGPTEASNLKVLSAMLYEKCMFRREKKTVLKELPDKVRQLITIDISNRQEYQLAENNLKEYLKKYKESTDKNIKNAMRSAAMVKLTLLRQITAKGKVKEAIDYICDFQQSGKKIIVFCSLHIVVDQLKHAFPTSVSVTGRENQEQKQRAVDSFQRNDKTNIIICSIKAAGVGLTLTASSDVLFIEFPWTDADCCQCEDRAHRLGQKDSVTGRYLSGKNTIDEKVYQIIQTKKGIASAIMGDSEAIPESTIDLIANMFD